MRHDNGAKIIGGNGVREAFDFYPTPREATVAVMDFLQLPRQKIWEPACGDRHMVNVLREYGHEVIGTDIRFGADFFTTEIPGIDSIITNPPFNLAEKFIKRSLEFTDTVAMLLKTQYWHASKRTALFNEKPPAWILPLNWRPNFFGDKAAGSPTMDFMWCVWLPLETDTRYRILSKPVEI